MHDRFRFINHPPVMIAMLLFSVFAALLVFLAGRGDQARDPRLTALALSLMAVFPMLWIFLPKVGGLPVAGAGGSDIPWMRFLLWIWLAASAVAAVRLGIAARGISGWRKRSLLVGRQDRVEIRRLHGLRSPVAAGVFRQVVFVPGDWNQCSEETRRIVLDHEMAHHHRRDPLWRWMGEIACVVHGGNPLVRWMVRRLTVQCEYACDARVLDKGVAVGDYARLLCDFAEVRAPRGPMLAMAESAGLEARVRRLVRPRGSPGNAGLFVLIALTLAGAAALALVGPAVPVASPDEVRTRWSADPFPGER